MEKAELIEKLQKLIVEIDELGDWTVAQGFRISQFYNRWIPLFNESQ